MGKYSLYFLTLGFPLSNKTTKRISTDVSPYVWMSLLTPRRLQLWTLGTNGIFKDLDESGALHIYGNYCRCLAWAFRKFFYTLRTFLKEMGSRCTWKNITKLGFFTSSQEFGVSVFFAPQKMYQNTQFSCLFGCITKHRRSIILLGSSKQ